MESETIKRDYGEVTSIVMLIINSCSKLVFSIFTTRLFSTFTATTTTTTIVVVEVVVTSSR